MDENHFMLISLEDSKSKAISEVLGSKTCKKIIAYLSERKEASQKDLSDALNIPMNTLDYNIKKLVESGFVQKKKEFFWSKKGKKIIMYELSNKSIIISPKKSTSQKFKSIIPAFILTAAGTFAVWAYEKIKYTTNYTQEIIQQPVMDCVERNSHELLSPESLSKGVDVVCSTVASSDYTSLTASASPLIWPWFLAGALLVILIFSIVNWKKI
ncbi:MAG TPA: helix-turn-helix domain-containing protein [Candidatus Pacearchaeota archaeon]|nr:helix-turn-helix domain-containing protein [Candidatus Pacearchaeota archaeon]HQF82701.1 helix-turn-helix domain-containing protein [Candidatus Pacearchaeota archaeon]HQI57571.1 helix-turn-helix domain-containing protein [Candidatus Pacearchaeota archaeon]